MTKYFAKKATCNNGHTHDSKREAARCDELHILQRAGQIHGLSVQPQFKYAINGDWLKLRNGQVAGYTADFQYLEGNKLVVEDVKAKNGYMGRDMPLRLALFRHLFPDLELRVTK